MVRGANKEYTDKMCMCGGGKENGEALSYTKMK